MKHPTFKISEPVFEDSTANQSTTIGNDLTLLASNRLPLDISNVNNNTMFSMEQTTGMRNQYYVPPVLKRAKLEDKHKDFHKKLQGKLDTLMKEKDYQLLLDLTKNKIGKGITIIKPVIS